MAPRKLWAALILGVFLASSSAAPRQSSENELLQIGIQALKAGSFEYAEQIFSRLVTQSPSAENLSYLAIAEAARGNRGQAIKHFQESIKRGNDSAPVHYNLGMAYLNSNLPEDGVRE